MRALVLAAALALSGVGALAGPVAAAEFRFNPRPWLEAALEIDQFVTVSELLGGGAPTSALDYGSDGRLSVMIVGSDWRERLAGYGERTDTMMVVSLNPQTHQLSMLSLPRDVGNVPIAPGVVFNPKINSLFKVLKRDSTREEALEGLRGALEHALAIEIDYVMYIRFDGLEAFVEELGGVPVQIRKDIYDSGIHDERADRPPGAKFLTDITAPLPVMLGHDAPLCGATNKPINWSRVRECRRALLYVRSRHGPGNNDWVRGRRQQDFLLDALTHVTSQPVTGFANALGARARGMPIDFYTTLPMNGSEDILALYTLAREVDPAQTFHVVLKPNIWAFTVPGTSKQELNIDVVRQMTREWFGPVN